MTDNGPGFALPDPHFRPTPDSDPDLLVFKPSGCSLTFGCPGMLLTALFVDFLVQAVFGRDWGLAGGMFVAVLAFSMLWLPFVIHMAGTRLLMTRTELDKRSLFGWRNRRIVRSEIAGVHVTTRRINLGNEDSPLTVDTANYAIIDRSGRQWARLRTPFFWRSEDGDRLKARLGLLERR